MTISKFYPRRIDQMRYAQNGFVPTSTLQWRLLEAQNHILAYRRKHFWSHSDYENRGFTYTSPNNSFRFHCHTGYGATNIVFLFGLGRSTNETAVDPKVEVDVTVSGGATTTYTLNHGNVDSTSDSPYQITERAFRAPVTANTTYEVLIKEVDFARILDGMAYEEGATDIDTTVDFYVDQSQGATGYPIYDQTVQDSLEGLSKMWRKNGAHLMTWAGDADRSPPTFASTSWANIIDGSTAAVSTASPSIHIAGPDEGAPLIAMARRSDVAADFSTGTVDCVLAVYCSVTNSATGEVKLVKTDGTTICSITGMGTAAAWYTSNVTITDAADIGRAIVQCRTSNAANTVTLYSVCLYTYLA